MKNIAITAVILMTVTAASPAGAANTAAASRPPEGCAVTVQQQCAMAGGTEAQAQCLQAHKDGLSDPCKAAMAQRPAAGIAKHMGNEPAPAADSQSAGKSPFDIRPLDMPTPARPASYPPASAPARAVPAMPYAPPRVILPPPPSETAQK